MAGQACTFYNDAPIQGDIAMAGVQRLKLHIKNNRSGEAVFRMTPERVAEALTRAPDIAGRIDTFID
jgi:hypothetical protein